MDPVNHLSGRLIFAVPKKGRLHQTCLELLSGSDIQFHRHSRLDVALVKNFFVALVFLPVADIPAFVGEGRVDLGITGRHQVAEYEAVTPPTETTGVEEILNLELGYCKLQVLVPEKGSIMRPEELIGKTIVTNFTNLAEGYFEALEEKQSDKAIDGDRELKLRTKVRYVGGSVEVACAPGVADGIVDLVEPGETTQAAGFRAISTALETTAILISTKQPSDPNLINLIASRIQGLITAQRFVLCTYNIERSKLDVAGRTTTGKHSPTINALKQEDWVAVSAMVERKKIADVMDELTRVGAEDILVRQIQNSRVTS